MTKCMGVNCMLNNADSSRIRFVVILILSMTMLFVLIGLFNTYKDNEGLRSDIKSDKQKISKSKTHNRMVSEREKKQNEKLGLTDVENASNEFNEKFYVWSNWQEFSDNMKSLRQTYPNLDSNDNVDISGKAVGTGDSPISNYESTSYTTTNKDELSEIITQEKKYDDHTTETLWHKVSNYKKGKYDISQFEKYDKIL